MDALMTHQKEKDVGGQENGEGMWLFVCFGTSSLKMNTFHVLGLSCHTRTMFYCILGFLGVMGGGQ